MLDIKFVREKSDLVEQALARRNGGFSAKALLAVDEKYRKAQADWEDLNRRSNEISQLFKNGALSAEDKARLQEETKQIKLKREDVDKAKNELESELLTLQLSLPNLPESSVPDGKDEAANVVVHKWGNPRASEGVRHHYEV